MEKKPEEQEAAFKYELFKEIAEHNLQMFINEFNNELFDYRVLNTHKITNVLSEDQVRQLGVNFFTKMVAKKSYEKQEFYFNILLTSNR